MCSKNVTYSLRKKECEKDYNNCEKKVMETLKNIMNKPYYKGATFSLATSIKGLSLNQNTFIQPASTLKMFTCAIALILFGPDSIIRTPIVTDGYINGDTLHGNLILVGSGDFTFGGRRITLSPKEQVGLEASIPCTTNTDIAYTSIDHLTIPYLIELTPQNPLCGIITLAQKLYNLGIRNITGSVFVDVSLFEPYLSDGIIVVSPIELNENVIDVVLTPTIVGQKPSICWRPKVSTYEIINNTITSPPGSFIDVQQEYQNDNHTIILTGTVPITECNVVTRIPIRDPADFAKNALIDALKNLDIAIQNNPIPLGQTKTKLVSYKSVPLSQTIKLILKVSSNPGADLMVILISLINNTTGDYNRGLNYIANFLCTNIDISPFEINLIDGHGFPGNFITACDSLKLLEYMRKQPAKYFQAFFNALPILGVDGTLQDNGVDLPARNHVFAKTGSLTIPRATDDNVILYVKGLAGYVETWRGNFITFAIYVNYAALPTNRSDINDILANVELIGQDLAIVSNSIYLNC